MQSFFKLLAGGLLLATTAALAQEPDQPAWDGIPESSIARNFARDGGVNAERQRLAAQGVSVSAIYVNDVLSNVHGGLRRGTIDQGKLQADLKLDLEKLIGWQGLTFHASGFQIHNTGRIRRDYVGAINTIAAIEAKSSTRLWEAWFEQRFWNGAASIRAGQLAADTEFFFAEASSLFLQADWPTIAALNLPSGGPAYPLSTPGVRLKLEPADRFAFLFAVFNGDPAGQGEGDEQERNRHGLNFRVNDPPLAITEAQWRNNAGKNDTGLASELKLGAWTHFAKFNDQRFSTTGALLANPAFAPAPLQHQRNFGVYAVAEQQLYRPKGADSQGGIVAFTRISASPSDRNPIDFHADGGIVFGGLIDRRPEDRFGVSVIHARYSNRLRDFDRDLFQFTGDPPTPRDYETSLEFAYRAQIVPGWSIQPDVQRIWHPSGDARRNATVVGIRSLLSY